jgi:hypothetical protein
MTEESKVQAVARKLRRGRKPSEKTLMKNINDDEMRLTDMEMLSLQLHENRVDMNRHQADKFALQEQLLTYNYVKQRDEIRMKQADCVRAIERAKDDYNSVRMKVQIRLGINLNDYTVNEAGILRLSPAVPEKE